MTERSELGVSASALAARGLRLIPLHGSRNGACTCGHSGCGSAGKHPRTHHGYKDAAADPEVIARWWDQWPSANLGIVTGTESGLLVLDVDPRHGGTDSLSEIEHEYGPLPETPEVETGGGGRHIYFKHPGGTVSCEVGIQVDGRKRPGLDLRGDGGYIVAPPSIHSSGATYRWIRSLEAIPLATPPRWLLLAVSQNSRRRCNGSDGEPIPVGERNQTLFEMAASWRRAGDNESAILNRLRAVQCTVPLTELELGGIATSVCKFPKAFHYTDLGNARRLVSRHGHNIRYCMEWNAWLIWSDTHWCKDASGEIARLAKDTIITLYGEASRVVDSEERQRLVRHAHRSESESRLRAMINLAATEPGIAVSHAAFDRDPWLFNVENGTVDLRTGELRSHVRDDHITRLAQVRYVPGATNLVWDAFLSRVVPDPEVERYLARGMGSTLTGVTEDEQLFFAYGPSNTGKSTFAEAVKALLGPYAATADFDLFLRKRKSGIPNDVARLQGTRMVVSLEVEDGQRLATALIKSLTGGDTITARFLHREFFEYVPQFKLWLFANHKPRTDAEDGAIWRRIRVVPFTVEIPPTERDAGVKRILRTDPRAREAILAWAVQGAREWHEQGLGEPLAVTAATQAYRDECDQVAIFIKEECVKDPCGQVGAGDLYAAFTRWCAENGEKPPASRAFSIRVTKLGIAKADRSTGGRGVRKGLRLSEPSDASEVEEDFFPRSLFHGENPPEGSLGSLASLEAETVEERAAIREEDRPAVPSDSQAGVVGA